MMMVLTVVQIAATFVVCAVTSVCNVVISSRTDCGTLEEPRDRVTRLFLEIFDFFFCKNFQNCGKSGHIT